MSLFRRFRYSLIFLFWSLSALADYCGGLLQVEIVSNVSKKYALGQGAKVILREQGRNTPFEAIFFGRSVRLNGTTHEYVFYEWKSGTIHLVEPQNVRVTSLGEDGSGVAYGKIAPIVRSRNQQGPTCAAYTLFNCFRQLNTGVRVRGNGVLAKTLEDEGSRQDFLASMIDKLYVSSQNGTTLDQTVRAQAERFGLLVQEVKGAVLPETVIKNLENGWPVLLRFTCGTDMCQMPFTMIQHSSGEFFSNRLWQPIAAGQKSNGGHAVLLSGIFEAGGKRSIIVSDPNFQAARFWPIENLNRWQSADLRAWTIFEKQN
jgi:hypothetical protein